MHKKAVVFWFFIIAAIICGSFIASACKDISFLSWLNYSASIGSSVPITLDLIIIKLTLGLELNISIAHIIFLLFALLLFPKASKSME